MRKDMHVIDNILHRERNINRADWLVEIVRTPRPSCISAWKQRESLRCMCPGDEAEIAGIRVKRIGGAHQRCCYKIDGRALCYADALAIIERREISEPLEEAS